MFAGTALNAACKLRDDTITLRRNESLIQYGARFKLVDSGHRALS